MGDLHLNTPYPHIHFGFGNRAKIDTDTIGQFTGLSDYNRTEIFEGDIVKCSYTHPVYIGSFDGPNEQEETVIGAVEYRNGCFFIGVYDIGSFDIDEMECIGNIHDNPKLLNNYGNTKD